MSAKISEAKTDEERLACPGCLVTEEMFRGMRSDVTEILVCLKGNEELGHRGIVSRTAENEKGIMSLKADAEQARTSLRVIGLISVGLASAISFAASVWPRGK